MFGSKFIFLVMVAMAAPSATLCEKLPPTARTFLGTFEGRHLKEFNQDLFLGVQFAKAPRLMNPRPITESWKGSRDARSNGLACYRAVEGQEHILENSNVTVGEECLNLNIIRPSGYSSSTNREKLPVVVWIHGGGFTAGFGADQNTNTSYMVKASVENKTPIIAITISYRLGILGFPGGPQATAAGILNLGLKDQRMALEWVRDNVAAFGGDPAKVTLWGQSAGANSIGHQILAYGGRKDSLFRGAILVSGSPFASNAMVPSSPLLTRAFDSAVSGTGCAGADNILECLREAPVDILWKSASAVPLPIVLPAIDGVFIEEPPLWQVQKGRFSKDISIVAGSNSDEGLNSAQTFGSTAETDQDVKNLLGFFFPAAREKVLDKILEAYTLNAASPPYSLPMTDDRFCEAVRETGLSCGNQYRRLASIFTDYAQVSSRRLMTEQWAAYGAVAYSYRFDTNPTSIPVPINAITPGFTTHASEYAYFFNFPPSYNMLNMNPAVQNISSHLQISRGIVDKLVSYISSGDPNTFNVPFMPKWPSYSLRKPVNMVFNATESDNKLNVHIEVDTWRSEAVKLWSRYGIELQFQSNWRP